MHIIYVRGPPSCFSTNAPSHDKQRLIHPAIAWYHSNTILYPSPHRHLRCAHLQGFRPHPTVLRTAQTHLSCSVGYRCYLWCCCLWYCIRGYLSCSVGYRCSAKAAVLGYIINVDTIHIIIYYQIYCKCAPAQWPTAGAPLGGLIVTKAAVLDKKTNYIYIYIN